MSRKLIFLGLILLGFWDLLAQSDEPEINVAGVRFLDYGSALPEDILSTKSVVLLQLPPKENTSIRSDWHPMAEEAHDIFRVAGVDAVAYYYLQDVLAGTEIRKSFAEEMTARGIKYLITLSNVWIKIKGKDSERFVIMITEFDGTPELMTDGQKAWKTQNKKFDKALDKLLKETTKGRFARSNLLISDYPELFRDFDIIKNRRTESYSNSLNSDKIVFEGFHLATVPDNRPGGIINNNVAKEAESANQAAVRNNNQMAAILKSYPYDYGTVTGIPDEQALLNQGYQYIVYQLYTAGTSIKYMLNYKVEEGISDYITVKQNGGSTILRNIPTEAPVYKFYLKQLRTKDVYVGNKWDADETWEEALKNFINNIKKEFQGK